MEIFLLLLDELDDAAAVLRVLWSRLFGFFLACGLFALTIVTAIHWPMLAILALSKSLGMSVVAEGVETAEQRDFLAAHGCDFAQGLLISPPVEAHCLNEWPGMHAALAGES